ncbi:MAG TPA: condensation domain-containing protein [Pseudonocardiaceae bacterium]|nr:condensation domain-containing protein [Pseudonocardiaceae bacterium]
MDDQLLVPFAGDDSGIDELTWGQQRIWAAMELGGGQSLNLVGVFPAPPGATVQNVAMMLRFLFGRHQSLRTRISLDADGRPRQAVADRGVVPVEIVAVTDDDPAGTAEAVRLEYKRANVDSVHEWPVRTAAIRHGDVLTHIVMMYNQLAVDATSLDLLTADVANMDPATGAARTPITATQPLELARQQRGAVAARQSASSLRYWERVLRTIPVHRFAESGDERVPRFWEIGYRSPAGYLAVHVIAARTGVDTGAVLLAAFAVALARVTGNNLVVTQTLMSNRFRPGFADIVSPMVQSGLCVIDVAGAATFDEVAARAQRTTMSAGMNAYYNLAHREELEATVAEERGDDVDISCYVNDRRRGSRQRVTDAVPTADDVRAALPLSVERFDRRSDKTTRKLFVNIDDIPGAMDVMMRADTRYLAPPDVSRCLREMEAVVVAAATEPLTGGPPSA